MEGDSLRLHRDVNIAVAVALDDGLVTPVLHRCQEMGLMELAEAARDLVARAREGRLRSEDLEGGTFTVSNLGMLGVTQFTAIVNPPQAAILAIGAVQTRPTYDAGTLRAAQVLIATLSADHRITDGVEASRFLARFKELLEASGESET